MLHFGYLFLLVGWWLVLNSVDLRLHVFVIYLGRLAVLLCFRWFYLDCVLWVLSFCGLLVGWFVIGLAGTGICLFVGFMCWFGCLGLVCGLGA